ncbi:hypothetical protein Kpol_1061p46 [Vanderwaltozyma polyspora DSM 70294]|uniref:DUF962 domain-containing protein n=1 Tax=Vanderwaltozyma polyspora (strain ATCC 22028 / DSM 70294 / BCRC 21397 / CBS 2163 / NBRC 10782 / NRRL Y-8283 / UCD 57-17) TaxID=436907 RepID=A7TJH1_VANPO|nr:uncharacterized protein Kpol_1061p46 [Vanderwaltozyma polyspora DSM 70294]EDO17621.1 hypothetical protein Kpol_1061p46 [Vanderwaltozyma polyspora DSM 70294]
MLDLLNLRKQLGFYKRYHQNVVNVTIHSFFVPTIFVTSCMMLNRVKLGSTGITLGHVLMVTYAFYYFLLHRLVGLLASTVIFVMNYFIQNNSIDFKFEIGLWLLSWAFQFMGHGVFEGNRPALFDNLVQSLVLAPYFILFEFLFVLGFCNELQLQLKRDMKK